MTRDEIIEKIKLQRETEESQHGTVMTAPHELETYLFYVQSNLGICMSYILQGDKTSAVKNLLNVITTAVAAMEQHGDENHR